MKVKSVTKNVSYVVICEEDGKEVKYIREPSGSWSYPNKDSSFNPMNYLAPKTVASFALDKLVLEHINNGNEVAYADSLSAGRPS